MKYFGKTFKSMKMCLNELEKFIRDGNHLETGKPLTRFGGLRSREILGNWLLCAVVNFERQSEFLRICTDPQGGDGVIYDVEKKNLEYMEHVLVSKNSKTTKNTETLILEQINKKRNKGGEAYASGKSLVVFLNKEGEGWFPNKIAKKLPAALYFNSVWIVGLHGVVDEEYIYNVAKLEVGGCPVWQVSIRKDFDAWVVERI